MPVSLTSFHDFRPDGILFSDAQTIYPQQESQTEYHKVYLQYSDQGERRDLVINSPSHLMSFGIQEKRDRETNDVIGYHIPVILWNRRGATEEEKQFTQTLEGIVDSCRSHIKNYYDTDPEKLNLLSWRSQENSEPYPVLYLKLITNRKTNRIMTLFINEDTKNSIPPN